MGIDADAQKYNDMLSGGVKVLYVMGNVPFDKRPDVDYLIVQAAHMTELAKQADVVLPAADNLESGGSVIDQLGRVKETDRAVEPPGEALPHRDIIARLAKEKGLAAVKAAKTSDAKKHAKATVKKAVVAFAKKDGMDVNVEEFNQAVNAPVINGSRLFWLKEVEKAEVLA